MVDIIKFVCALLVVAIHFSPLSSYYDNNEIYKYLDYGIQNYVARIAVPFYFAAAGFFLCRKIDFEMFDVSITKNYVFKLWRFLGVWMILLIGPTNHLWYINGLVIAVCTFSVMAYKKVPLYKMAIIAVILYIIGLSGDAYYGLLCPLQKYNIIGYPIKAFFAIFNTTRNGIFMGFPFFLLGVIIQKKKIHIKKPCYAFFAFIFSMVLLFFEAILLKLFNLPKDVNMYIFVVPSVFFLLLFSVNISIKPHNIYKRMRNAGIIIYFSHFFVNKLIVWGFKLVDIVLGIKINNSLICYFLTIIIAAALGILIDKLSQNKKFAFLKYLYS